MQVDIGQKFIVPPELFVTAEDMKLNYDPTVRCIMGVI